MSMGMMMPPMSGALFSPSQIETPTSPSEALDAGTGESFFRTVHELLSGSASAEKKLETETETETETGSEETGIIASANMVADDSPTAPVALSLTMAVSELPSAESSGAEVLAPAVKKDGMPAAFNPDPRIPSPKMADSTEHPASAGQSGYLDQGALMDSDENPAGAEKVIQALKGSGADVSADVPAEVRSPAVAADMEALSDAVPPAPQFKKESENGKQPSPERQLTDRQQHLAPGSSRVAGAETHETELSAEKKGASVQEKVTPAASDLGKSDISHHSSQSDFSSFRAIASSMDGIFQNNTESSFPTTEEAFLTTDDNVEFQKSVMDQIVERAVLRSTAERSEMRIQLKPEFLGDIRMAITSENSQLSVKLITDQIVTKEILESQIHHLKAEFDRQGLVVNKIEVSVQAENDPNLNDRSSFFQMADERSGNGRNEHGEMRHGQLSGMVLGDEITGADPDIAESRDRISYFA